MMRKVKGINNDSGGRETSKNRLSVWEKNCKSTAGKRKERKRIEEEKGEIERKKKKSCGKKKERRSK